MAQVMHVTKSEAQTTISLVVPYLPEEHESETALDWLDGEYFLPLQGRAWEITYGKLHFDAFIDNREMTIEQQNEAVWKLVNEKGWT